MTLCKNRVTYLKLKTVYFFVAAVYDTLVYSWTCNWPDCAINEPETLGEWSSFSMNGCGEVLWVHPNEVQIIQEVTKSAMYIINDLQSIYEPCS